ncbi:unnamed protein product [Symbiodinium natans]|uniref:PAS domain-containing protein n=1 Tax=Symbiodinium natans TaxID=878477 RepID=A0A812IFY1_9DINO|nr:unnamed protein product [Symbiodinium natans]
MNEHVAAQQANQVLWLAATAMSVFLRLNEHCRRFSCDVEMFAVAIFAILGFCIPHADLYEHSFDVHEIMAATFEPVALALSASALPLRCSRFLLVVFSYSASFLIRYILTKNAAYLADAALIFVIPLFACLCLMQRDRLLLEGVAAEKQLEECMAKMVAQEEEATTQQVAAAAMRSLLRQHTDVVVTLTDRLTIAQSSHSLDAFFGQEMRGRPLLSVIPSYEHQQIVDAIQEVVSHRRPAAATATLPLGPARLVIECAGREKPLHFFVAITLQDRSSREAVLDAAVEEDNKKFTQASTDPKEPYLWCLEGHGHSLMAMMPAAAKAQGAMFTDPLVNSKCPSSGSCNSPRSSQQSRKDKDTWKHADELLSISLTNTDPLSSSLQSAEKKHEKREDKEIQVSMETVSLGITQSVQTEFTWDQDGMTCYHCLMSRPPRPAIAEGRGSSWTKPSSGGSRRVRRNSSRVSLRNADDACPGCDCHMRGPGHCVDL